MIQYNDILTKDEISQLNDYFDLKEYSSEDVRDTVHGNLLRYRNKHSDYDIDNSVVRNIVYPKIQSLIGEHFINSGAFLESHYPFGLHVDTNQQFLDKSKYLHSNPNIEKAIIIPLNESDKFNTVFFDHHVDLIKYQCDNSCNLNNLNDFFIDGIDLSHLNQTQRDYIADKYISGVFNWKIGSVAIWPRNQLHCSSNFYKTDLVKKAITLFV